MNTDKYYSWLKGKLIQAKIELSLRDKENFDSFQDLMEFLKRDFISSAKTA